MPTDEAEMERYHRTLGERIDEEDLEDVTQAKASGAKDHPDNLRALCKPCHSRETARQLGPRGVG